MTTTLIRDELSALSPLHRQSGSTDARTIAVASSPYPVACRRQSAGNVWLVAAPQHHLLNPCALAKKLPRLAALTRLEAACRSTIDGGSLSLYYHGTSILRIRVPSLSCHAWSIEYPGGPLDPAGFSLTAPPHGLSAMVFIGSPSPTPLEAAVTGRVPGHVGDLSLGLTSGTCFPALLALAGGWAVGGAPAAKLVRSGNYLIHEERWR